MVKPWTKAWAATERPVLKLKIAEFAEGPGPSLPASPSTKLLDEHLFALATNPNRLAAASSKIGSLADRAHWSAIAGEVARDSLDEVGLGTDHPIYDRLTVAALDALACQRHVETWLSAAEPARKVAEKEQTPTSSKK